jgi:hypothetical protein
MTKLKAVTFGAIIVAGVAIPLAIHYQTQTKLRDRDLLVQQQNDQLAQLAAENARLSNLVAQANNSAAQDQSSELLRLRGEVGVLKGQLAAAANLQERTKRAAQAKSEIDPAEQQKEMGIFKMGYSQEWMKALTLYASQNRGQFPTNLDEALAFFPDELKGGTNLIPTAMRFFCSRPPPPLSASTQVVRPIEIGPGTNQAAGSRREPRRGTCACLAKRGRLVSTLRTALRLTCGA